MAETKTVYLTEPQTKRLEDIAEKLDEFGYAMMAHDLYAMLDMT